MKYSYVQQINIDRERAIIDRSIKLSRAPAFGHNTVSELFLRFAIHLHWARPALQLLDARMVCVLSGEIENVAVCRVAGVVTRRHNAGRLARQFNDQVQRGRTPNELVLRRGCAHAAADAAFYIRNSNKLNAICCSHCFKEYLKEIDFVCELVCVETLTFFYTQVEDYLRDLIGVRYKGLYAFSRILT